jgi:hypothetical protein
VIPTGGGYFFAPSIDALKKFGETKPKPTPGKPRKSKRK